MSLAVDIPSIPKLLGIMDGFFFISVDVEAQHCAFTVGWCEGLCAGSVFGGFPPASGRDSVQLHSEGVSI